MTSTDLVESQNVDIIINKISNEIKKKRMKMGKPEGHEWISQEMMKDESVAGENLLLKVLGFEEVLSFKS